MYRNPTPTVDIIIEIKNQVVLIERKNEPWGWALPGGFVDEGEMVEEAAVREAEEETGLKVQLTELLYVYSHPSRDQRQHTMSTVFIARAGGKPVARDDAADTGLFSLTSLPAKLAFDHAMIIADYARYIDTGEKPTPAVMLGRFQ